MTNPTGSSRGGAARRRWTKRTGIVILAAAWLCAALPPAATADKSYRHPSISMTISLGADGSAEVDEVRSYRFDGSFSYAWLRKSTQGQYGRYGIEYLDVTDADTGEPLRFERSREDGYEIVTWHYSASDETRRFRIRYRIRDAVQRYGDAAQFYFRIIGEEHERIDRLEAAIVPPAPSESLLKVFVHGPVIGALDIAGDRSRASVSMEDVPRNRFVEIRALMDPALFGGAPLRGGESHASLLEDERRATEQWRLEQQQQIERSRRRSRELVAALILGAAMALALALVFMRFFREYGREHDVGYRNRYEREPPRDLPPCYLPAIMTQSRASIPEMGKAFVASLLECGRLGLLEISEREERGLLFKKKDLEYELTDRGAAALEGSGEGLPRELTFFERDVLEAVFRGAGNGATVTGEELKKWSARKAGTRTNFYSFVEKRAKRLRGEFERRWFRLDDPASEKAKGRFFLTAALVGVVPAAVFLAVTRNPIIIPFGLLVVAAGAILTVPMARRTREAALEHARWTAFKRFMTDFSAMKDAGPSLLPLWERFLVYAAALGVTDKLLKNIELVAREYDAAVPAVLWFHPLTTDASGIAGGGAAIGSVGASIANLQALSSALSTTTSTGGGFSGGGGGGGGGGGSGAG